MSEKKKDRGTRKRFYDGYELAKYRKWRGFKDSWLDYVEWLKDRGVSGELIKSDPVRAFKAFTTYRWMAPYLASGAMVDRTLEDAEGVSLKIGHEFMRVILKSNVKALVKIIAADKRFGDNELADKMVLFEQITSPILIGGFPNLVHSVQEPYHTILPTANDQHGGYYFTDIIDSYGLPSDSCRVSSSICGVAIDDQLPIEGACVITSNAPCDSSVMNSSVVARRLNIPSIPGCTPMRWRDESVQEYAVAHVKEIIKFIEDTTGEKFDWDAFFKVVENYNEETRIQLELWELAKTPYYPVPAVPNLLFRSFQLSFSSGLAKEVVEVSRDMLKLCEECYEKKINMRPKTRHRLLVCGAPASYYMHFSTWMYECWGVNTVAVMNNLSHHEYISTTDKEEALLGVAKLWEQAIMRRHLVGGYENMLEMFEEYERFNCDMIMFYDDITCKGSKSMTGIIQDTANERNIPLMWVSHDVIDPRTISRNEMRRQFNDFMFTVMNEKPLDESLLDFDDSKGW